MIRICFQEHYSILLDFENCKTFANFVGSHFASSLFTIDCRSEQAAEHEEDELQQCTGGRIELLGDPERHAEYVQPVA